MEPLELKVTVTKDDLLELRHDAHENVGMWLGYIVVLWFLSAIADDAQFILMGLAALIFAGLEIGRHRSLTQSLRMWADVGEVSYVFGEADVRMSHSKGERRYNWPTITGFRDYKSATLLYYCDLQSIFIPKRCLEEGELEKLSQFLKQTRNLTQEEGQKRRRRQYALLAIVAAVLAALVYIVVFENIGWQFTIWDQ